jgi:hypothetical protein
MADPAGEMKAETLRLDFDRRLYREEADRVRKLAADAVLPGVRDALLSVVRQAFSSGLRQK